MPLDHLARNTNSCKSYLNSFALSKLKDMAFPLSNTWCNTSVLKWCSFKNNLLVSLNVNNSLSQPWQSLGYILEEILPRNQTIQKGSQPSNPGLPNLSSSRHRSPDKPISWREKAANRLAWLFHHLWTVVSSVVSTTCKYHMPLSFGKYSIWLIRHIQCWMD